MGRKTNLQKRLEARENEKADLEMKLANYDNADELLGDYILEAIKRWIIEMNFAEKSQDRLKASQHIVYQLDGKPLEKILNITARVSDFSNKEMKMETERLLEKLGYKKRTTEVAALVTASGSGVRQNKSPTVRGKSRVSGKVPQKPEVN